MKFTKEKLDQVWPTLSVEVQNDIYTLVLKGLAELAASIGYTLTERSEGAKAEIFEETIPVVKVRKKRVRVVNIKIHDRTFKDPQAIANFYKCSKATVFAKMRDGILEDYFKKVKGTQTIIKRTDKNGNEFFPVT